MVFFENQYFFQTHLTPTSPPTISLLPSFSDPPSSTRFKPGPEYVTRSSHNRAQGPPLPMLDLAPDLAGPVLRRSTHLSTPPDRYGFSPSALFIVLSSIFIFKHLFPSC